MSLKKLAELFSRWVASLLEWLNKLVGPPLITGPHINAVSPSGGWPGTIVTIEGGGLTAVRDDVTVTIGGARALVITAEPQRLVVLAGEDTVTGPVVVQISSATATSVAPFEVLPRPDVRDLGVAGPPVFFHGPQSGTPALGVADQPVLVVFVYPTDHNPGTPAQRTATLTAERAKFQTARRFWQEASYHSTSWRFDFTDFLPLPADRNYYMWQREDVYDRRRALLEATKRAAVMHNGQVYGTHLDDVLATVQVNNPNAPNPVSYTSKKLHGTGVRIKSGRALVTAGTDGLWVYDLTNSPATYVTKTAAGGGYFADVDVIGNLCAVAALGAGLHLYDVTYTSMPTLKGSFTDGIRQVSAVCVAPNRAYIGIDEDIAIIDTTTPAAPTMLGTLNIGAFSLDLSLQGTTLAAATDGGGVVLLDVSGPTPVRLSAILNVERVHGVFLTGTRLFAAGANQGLAVYNVANPAAPLDSGSVPLVGPAYDVIADGNQTYVSVGRRRLAVVDVSGPAPIARGIALMGAYQGGSFEADLTSLRASIDQAEQNQNLAQRQDALFIDALEAAKAAGVNLDGYVGIVVVVNGPFLRGASNPQAIQFTHDDTGKALRLNNTKGSYYVATGATWGRIAHETGHWLGMTDIYEEWQADGTVLRGTAQGWCMSGDCNPGPLFGGHQINEVMHFYSSDNAPTLTWSPTAPPLDRVYDIVAHDAAQNTTRNTDPERVHTVKIVVSEGLMYFVEVRQIPVGLIFDQSINPIDATTNAAVVVTRAHQGTTPSNTFERPVMLAAVLQVGEQFVDAARGLTVHVDSVTSAARPAVYRVRIRWNQYIPGDPNGKFDLTITPWNTKEWETPDIWVDSPRNNSGATPVYADHVPGDPSAPLRNGDRPWVKHDNRIYTRIRNTGPEPVNDVYVSIYTASPPGIGDNGNWELRETIVVPTVTGFDPAIPGSGEHVADTVWQPEADKHSCIKVAIFPQAGEIETNNNLTQENVFTFDSAGASSHDPVMFDAAVRNPFTIYKKVDLLARGLPFGWHCVVDHQWVWTGPRGEHEVVVVIWTDLNAPYSFSPEPDRHERIENAALARVEGWTTFDDHRYLPIGGILADVKANKKVDMTWRIAASQRGGLTGIVCVGIPDVPITVEVTNSAGESTLVHLMTGANGCADLSQASQLGLAPGTYIVQAFVTAGGPAAETESDARTIVVP